MTKTEFRFWYLTLTYKYSQMVFLKVIVYSRIPYTRFQRILFCLKNVSIAYGFPLRSCGKVKKKIFHIIVILLTELSMIKISTCFERNKPVKKEPKSEPSKKKNWVNNGPIQLKMTQNFSALAIFTNGSNLADFFTNVRWKENAMFLCFRIFCCCSILEK